MSNHKVRVGILGATGMVGQRFVQMLEHHPEFEITALAASDRSQGKTYGEACTWRLVGDMPAFVKSMVVQPPQPPLDCDVVVSSLPSDVARSSEEAFAQRRLSRHQQRLLVPHGRRRSPADSRNQFRPLESAGPAEERARIFDGLHCHQSELLDHHHGAGSRAAAREIWHSKP